MKQEDKELLIKDLCARLPYGVQVQDTRCGISGKLHDMLVFPLYKGNNVYDYIATTNFYTDCYYDNIEYFKPYLFPLSSMTEKQMEEYHNNCNVGLNRCGNEVYYDCVESIDWLNANHFDWRGLIPMGSAIDATGKNIY